MANDRLRTALLQRGVTPAELADAAGVDAKTVERWIGGRIPYRRHRYLVATRLQADGTYLWPDALAPSEVADASESEIFTVYPHRWAVPRDAWGHLFGSAQKEIGVVSRTDHPPSNDLSEAFTSVRPVRGRARAGVQVAR